MKNFIVYQTVNTVNGHFYIGKTTRYRHLSGYKGSGSRIKEAFAKYGKENFICYPLYEFDTEAEAFAKEKELVTEELVANPNCYNMQVGGDGTTAGAKFLIKGDHKVRVLPGEIQKYLDAGYVPWKRPHSEETKKKMSESHKGMPGTMKGRHHSEESKKKISEAGKGRKHTEEWKQMMHDRFVGKPRDPELMKRIAATKKAKGIKMSEEARQKMSEAHKGKPAWNRGKKATTQNLYWVNDKQINRRVSEEERDRLISEGWSSGKIKKVQNLFIMD